MSEEGIVSRIQKLMSLALNNSNPAEAEAAMAKARELMLKHAVDEAHLAGKEAPVEVSVYIVDLGRFFEGWMKLVQLSIAKLYEANLYLSSRVGYEVATFVCATSDLELLKESYGTVVASILRESAKLTGGRSVTNSFRVGAADGLQQAIFAATKAPLPEVGGATSEEVTALVLSRKEAIAQRSAELFPRTSKTTFQARVSDSDAYNQGYAYGKSLNTGKVTKKLE